MKNHELIEAVLTEIDGDLRLHLHDEAFLIGSSAACLSGADVEALDLDLLTSIDDAVRLEQIWEKRRMIGFFPADDQLFRSRFARYAFKAMPMEIMGGLQVHVRGTWQSVTIKQADPLPGYTARICLPTVSEQLRVLDLFGRAKDHRRAELLSRL